MYALNLVYLSNNQRKIFQKRWPWSVLNNAA